MQQEYPKEYTSTVSTRVSNALLVGEIIGQITIGLVCDYLGRKVAIVTTTLMIVIGGILATASHGVTINGMFWMLTVCRGIVGFGVGGTFLLENHPKSKSRPLTFHQVNTQRRQLQPLKLRMSTLSNTEVLFLSLSPTYLFPLEAP